MKNLKLQDLSRISMFAALITVMEYLETLIPSMQNGGTLALSQLTITSLAIIMATKKDKVKTNFLILFNAVLVSLVTGYALGLFPHMKGPVVFVLDYFIPFTVPTLLVFVNKKIIPIALAITIFTIIVLASHTISGVLIYKATFKASLVYNSTYVIPTFLVELPVILLLTKSKIRIN